LEDLAALLDSVGLAVAHARGVRELSGGEQQRLAVACALAGEPELVVLDEPTASLDRSNATSLVEVLAGVAARGSTMVIATHDPLVIEAGDVIVELDHGRRVR
jgi:ABC-type lipoprotein export system ATPase subunit